MRNNNKIAIIRKYYGNIKNCGEGEYVIIDVTVDAWETVRTCAFYKVDNEAINVSIFNEICNLKYRGFEIKFDFD